MTATTARPKAPARVPCPHCSHKVDNTGSLPAHIAMAHKDVPMDVIAPKRSARNGAATSTDVASDSSSESAAPPAAGPGTAAPADVPPGRCGRNPHQR